MATNPNLARGSSNSHSSHPISCFVPIFHFLVPRARSLLPVLIINFSSTSDFLKLGRPILLLIRSSVSGYHESLWVELVLEKIVNARQLQSTLS